MFSSLTKQSDPPRDKEKTRSPASKSPLRKLTPEISGPSIKSALEGNKTEEEKSPAKREAAAPSGNSGLAGFTEKALREKWGLLLEIFNDRPNLKSALNRDPLLQPGQIILLKLDNVLQDEIIKSNKPFLVNWLRRELENPGIELTTEVLHDVASRKPYTDSEKFDEMASKNQHLLILKQRFMLDFDDLTFL